MYIFDFNNTFIYWTSLLCKWLILLPLLNVCFYQWDFSPFLIFLLVVWSFLFYWKNPFNISCMAGLVVINSFSFCLVNCFCLFQFWMISLKGKVFMTVGFFLSVLWEVYVAWCIVQSLLPADSLLNCRVSAEKSAGGVTGVTLCATVCFC